MKLTQSIFTVLALTGLSLANGVNHSGKKKYFLLMALRN
jgi:hypothetical protein